MWAALQIGEGYVLIFVTWWGSLSLFVLFCFVSFFFLSFSYLLILESQSQRTIWIGRNFWMSSSPMPCSEQGTFRSGCLGHFPVEFWIFLSSHMCPDTWILNSFPPCAYRVLWYHDDWGRGCCNRFNTWWY